MAWTDSHAHLQYDGVGQEAIARARTAGVARMICIGTDAMTLDIGDRVVATARYSEQAAADGNGAWIVSTHPARLFSRNQAITAMILDRPAKAVGLLI